jgi:hypothetical protein
MRVASPLSFPVIFHLAGALNEHDHDDGAVGNRDARFISGFSGVWPPNADGDEIAASVREGLVQIRPFSTGGNYVNFQMAEDDASRTADAYGTRLERLQRIKATYDPDNLVPREPQHPPGGLTTVRWRRERTYDQARHRSDQPRGRRLRRPLGERRGADHQVCRNWRRAGKSSRACLGSSRRCITGIGPVELKGVSEPLRLQAGRRRSTRQLEGDGAELCSMRTLRRSPDSLGRPSCLDSIGTSRLKLSFNSVGVPSERSAAATKPTHPPSKASPMTEFAPEARRRSPKAPPARSGPASPWAVRFMRTTSSGIARSTTCFATTPNS